MAEHAEFVALTDRLFPSQTALAEALGVQLQTVNGWYKRRVPVPEYAVRFLRLKDELEELRARQAAADTLADAFRAFAALPSGR